MLEFYLINGYSGPFRLLKAEEVPPLLKASGKFPERFLPSLKSRHSITKEVAALAAHPAIIEKVKIILGEDILLSGSQLIKQKAGKKFPWHVDREHLHWEGLTVWIALQNVVPGQSIGIITGSQNIDLDPAHLEDLRVNPYEGDEVAAEIQKVLPGAKLVMPNIRDGEFLIFNGKTWHGTQNITSSNRYALLLQYCKPNQKIRAIKDIDNDKVIWHRFEPECLWVSGEDKYGINKMLKSQHIGSVSRKVKSIFYHAPSLFFYKFAKAVKKKLTKSTKSRASLPL